DYCGDLPHAKSGRKASNIAKLPVLLGQARPDDSLEAESNLAEVRRRFGLGVERDLFWKAEKTLSEIRQGGFRERANSSLIQPRPQPASLHISDRGNMHAKPLGEKPVAIV